MEYFNFLQSFNEENDDRPQDGLPSEKEALEHEVQPQKTDEKETKPESDSPTLFCEEVRPASERTTPGQLETNQEQPQQEEEESTDLPRPKTSPGERRQEF